MSKSPYEIARANLEIERRCARQFKRDNGHLNNENLRLRARVSDLQAKLQEAEEEIGRWQGAAEKAEADLDRVKEALEEIGDPCGLPPDDRGERAREALNELEPRTKEGEYTVRFCEGDDDPTWEWTGLVGSNAFYYSPPICIEVLFGTGKQPGEGE